LESLYGAEAVSVAGPQAAGLNLPTGEIDFARLGGSTRLGHVVTTLPSTDWKAIERELPRVVVELAIALPEGKIQLGLSAFDLKITPAKLNAAGLTLKKTLRAKTGRSVRVTPNPELELNTAQVLHNHLTGPTGIELLLIATSDDETVIARATQVQDIDSYTLRDRGRPKRDARVGMLPPKLAQIIINLATSDTNPRDGSLILDPFCGTGVVLQEASLMGFGLYGSDLDQRMIDYTDANLQWFLALPGNKITPYSENKRDYRLEVGDATTHHWKPAPNFVAGETYLGRPFTAKPSPEVLAQTVSEVNLILKKFLQNIHGQLVDGARLCVAVPAWQTAPDQFKHLPLIDQISELGYNRVKFEHVRDSQLLYYREDQIVARELVVLTRK